MQCVSAIVWLLILALGLLTVATALPRRQRADLTLVRAGQLPHPVRSLSAVYDGDDSIFILGGVNSAEAKPDQVYRFSLVSGSFEPVTRFQNISTGAAVYIGGPDGEIVYFGGYLNHQGRVPYVYRLSTRTGAHSIVVNFPSPMLGLTAVWDPIEQSAYVFGGYSSQSFMDGIYHFNATNNDLGKLAGDLPAGRYQAAAVWDTARKVAYVFGGRSSNSATQQEVLVFDPRLNGVEPGMHDLPFGLDAPSAVFSDLRNTAYIVDWNGTGNLTAFDADTGMAEPLHVDNWQPLAHTALVYVPKLDRLYVFGGHGYFPGEGAPRDTDWISYIDLGP